MTALQLSLLLGLFGKAAHTTEPVCVDASLDRVEEEWAVLDVPEYPSMNVPVALVDGMREGAAIQLCAQVKDHDLVIYVTHDPVREKANREAIREAQRKARDAQQEE